jgi:Raf kinase inhibitor-like YbhB/YbcL family protein
MGAIDSIKSAIGKVLRPVRGSEHRIAIHKIETVSRITISSTAFSEGGPIPMRHVSDRGNVSPPLSWSGVPLGTVSLALLCEDPDAPSLRPFVHWVVYAIPPTMTALPEGLAEATPSVVQGKNTMGHCRYDGPAPPPGHGTHHYHFQLFALDVTIQRDEADREDLLDDMRGHVLAAGEFVGTYER